MLTIMLAGDEYSGTSPNDPVRKACKWWVSGEADLGNDDGTCWGAGEREIWSAEREKNESCMPK
jgi:hypothetical protein